MSEIDSKFIQLLILISAIIALFLKFVILPTGTSQRILYGLVILSFLLSLILAFLGYRTNKYKAIDINELIAEHIEGKKLLELKKSVAGTIGENIEKIKKINIRKGRLFDWSFIFIFLGIVLSFILNLLQGGLNV
jgi:hypothetical protein